MDHSVCVQWWKEKEKELTSLTFGQLESRQILRDRKLCNLKSCLSGTYRKPRFIFLLLTLLYARKMCTSASVVLLVPLSDALCACFLDPNGLPSWKLTADRWGSWSIQCYLVIISFTPSCRMFKMFLKWPVKWPNNQMYSFSRCTLKTNDSESLLLNIIHFRYDTVWTFVKSSACVSAVWIKNYE